MAFGKISSLALVASATMLVAHPAMASEPAGPASCDVKSLSSPPGQEWNNAYGWRYNTSTNADPEERAAENLANREKAYATLLNGKSPWPAWFEPDISLLAPGTLFQMAMGPKDVQPDTWPGKFGTFDDIRTVLEVREDLAVIWEWKKVIDRVNVYRVTETLPVSVGPIGPQIDPHSCKLLPGRFSQFEMLVPTTNRMHYLELVESHKID